MKLYHTNHAKLCAKNLAKHTICRIFALVKFNNAKVKGCKTFANSKITSF
nr:MAG TPA: hypothetical protein [Caudoviricetes sp.]